MLGHRLSTHKEHGATMILNQGKYKESWYLEKARPAKPFFILRHFPFNIKMSSSLSLTVSRKVAAVISNEPLNVMINKSKKVSARINNSSESIKVFVSSY
jgi:hypothetical protein